MTLPRNTKEGKWIASVEELGRVPPCVADAFSWLPHPYGVIGRGKKARAYWFWEGLLVEGKQALSNALPPPILNLTGQRCDQCIFQEPAWSQGYARCSHSWLYDHDGDCQAFIDRDEFLKVQPTYAQMCVPPRFGDSVPGMEEMVQKHPYRQDGTCYADYGPSCNLPSGYHARLNMPQWFTMAQPVYEAIEYERLRRFRQWARMQEIQQTGVYQYDMFLDADALGE